MSALVTEKTPVEALNLRATVDPESGQFKVENDHMRLRYFDNEYVSFSGFAGQHNPCIFAAAPMLLDAAEKALNYIANTESELGITMDSGDALRAAIAKARGEA